MPEEKWRHYQRETTVRTRICPGGGLKAKVTVKDLFVPEDFEKGDEIRYGKVDVKTERNLTNRVAVMDFVGWSIGEQQKGIEPKEVGDG